MSEKKEKLAKAKGAESHKKHRVSVMSLGFKFSAFTVLLIAFIMGAIGVTLYVQQSRSLTHEVLERGKTIAEGAAGSARESLIGNPDVLTLSVLAARSVQQGESDDSESGFDFHNPQDWFDGMAQAFSNLQTEVPLDLEHELDGISGGSINLGLAQSGKLRKKLPNEGVFECYILDRTGSVVSYYNIHKKDEDTSEVLNKSYVPPHFIEEANEDTPFPVYEDEWFDAQHHRHAARLFDVAAPISEKGPTGQDVNFGMVHVGLNQALISRVVFQSAMRIADIAMIAIIVGLIVTIALVSFLTAPIGRLLKGVLAIAGGDFNTRLKVTSKDELGELTSAFNDMAKSLDENELLRGAFTRYVSDAALQQLLADPSKTGLHSRRALATVYTSDVRGFTAMSESLEPEHVVQVINTYLSLQTEILSKYEGVVDKFIGDATVGVFGKEQEKDDDAIRAVRSAVEVQKRIEELNKEREKSGEIVKLIGIGINTGIVVTGNMGSTKKMEYTTAGENVILADKLCAECPGGKVWISESTYELVRDEVNVEEKEPLKLKGRSEGFPVFEVVGLK